MKFIILSIWASFSLYSFELEGIEGKFESEFKLRKINEKVILDPTVEITKFKINNKIYEFKTKDLFLKQYSYKKEIFGFDKQKHLSIKLKKVKEGLYYSVLDLRIFKKKSTETLRGYIKLKKTPFTNKPQDIELLGQI